MQMRDHPRIRGTNHPVAMTVVLLVGSSPHTRDKFVFFKENYIHTRIIPAYAGQIRHCLHCHNSKEDHPRIRGTNFNFCHQLSCVIGSSPHTRDKFPVSDVNICSLRIIPAYAGQIFRNAIHIRYGWDHPRIRGTNVVFFVFVYASAGSSPHTRDK